VLEKNKSTAIPSTKFEKKTKKKVKVMKAVKAPSANFEQSLSLSINLQSSKTQQADDTTMFALGADLTAKCYNAPMASQGASTNRGHLLSVDNNDRFIPSSVSDSRSGSFASFETPLKQSQQVGTPKATIPFYSQTF